MSSVEPFKNKRVTLCTVHGLIWHGFNMPKKALFGVSDGVPYAVVDTPKNKGSLRIFVLNDPENNQWLPITACLSLKAQIGLNAKMGMTTDVYLCKILVGIAHKVMDYIISHGTPIIEPWRDMEARYSSGLYYIVPHEKRAQSNYSQQYRGKYHAPAELVGYSSEADGSKKPIYTVSDSKQDVPITRDECYWSTGKNSASTAHKKPKTEKNVIRKKQSGDWIKVYVNGELVVDENHR